MSDSVRSRAGFSRREFLKGSGAAAAATAVVGAPLVTRGEEATGLIRGAEEVTLQVNGKKHRVRIEPRTTLLEVLRYQLGLTGAKPVSTDGCCGGSTVLLEGKPISAATTLALDCVGKQITTVEGLGAKDEVVQAFVHQDAMQCGFCTPGFVVAVKAFLKKHPNATEEEVREGLNGNLCRCGTYVNVIRAALEVVKGGHDG